MRWAQECGHQRRAAKAPHAQPQLLPVQPLVQHTVPAQPAHLGCQGDALLEAAAADAAAVVIAAARRGEGEAGTGQKRGMQVV